MKFRHQAALMRRAREKMGLTCEQMARAIGLNERPGAQYVSKVENGLCRMTPKRWKYIKGVVAKEEILDAFVADCAEVWENEYDGKS